MKAKRAILSTFIILVPYWGSFGAFRNLMSSMSESVSSKEDFSMSWYWLYWYSYDILSTIIVLAVLIMATQLVQKSIEGLRWQLIFLELLFVPVVLISGALLLGPPFRFPEPFYLAFGDYVFFAPMWPGSSIAAIALVATMCAIPFLFLSARIFESKWPRFSLTQLIIAQLILGSVAFWAHDYLSILLPICWSKVM